MRLIDALIDRDALIRECGADGAKMDEVEE